MDLNHDYLEDDPNHPDDGEQDDIDDDHGDHNDHNHRDDDHVCVKMDKSCKNQWLIHI